MDPPLAVAPEPAAPPGEAVSPVPVEAVLVFSAAVSLEPPVPVVVSSLRTQGRSPAGHRGQLCDEDGGLPHDVVDQKVEVHATAFEVVLATLTVVLAVEVVKIVARGLRVPGRQPGTTR
jgi:hypothetical protein